LRKRIFYKSTIYFLVILLITSSVFPGLNRKVEAATPEAFLDPFLENWIPQPGQPPGYTEGFASLLSNHPADYSSIPSLINDYPFAQSPELPTLEDLVEIPKGDAVVQRDDFILPSYGFPVTIQRLYKSSQKGQLSSFGYGWTFPYNHYIQMFDEFHITEFKSDGSKVNYTFHKEDEKELVDEYDGDPAIYYPLDKGYYTTEGSAKSSLERISKDEYRVTHPHGTTYIFKGYYAPWRTDANPAAGKLMAVEDRNGNRVDLSYDSEGRLVEIKSDDGRKVTFEYSGQLITKMTDPIGRVTKYSYENNELRKVIYPDGTTETYEYGDEHRLISVTDSRTGTKQLTYTGDRVLKVTHEGDLLSRYEYGNDYVKVYDALGHSTTYYYNSDNHIFKKVDSIGKTYTYNYDDQKRLTKVIGPIETVSIEYNEFHNATAEKSSLGEESYITYDPNLQLPTIIKDGEGRVWKRTYDAKGNLISIEYPLSQKEEFTYDSRGLVIESRDLNNRVTKYSYDDHGQLKTVTNPLGQKISYTYDQVGRLKSVTMPNGSVTTYTYDNGDRLVSITDAKNRSIRYEYDSKGRMIKAKLPNGAVYEYQYNAKGQVISKKEPNGVTISYTYDAKGQLTGIQGPQGATVSYSYDPLGRVISQSGSLLNTETFEYDALNRLIKHITPFGTWEYQYNSKNQLEKEFLNRELYTSYTYDTYGFPKSATNAKGETYTYSYDKMGHLLSIIDPKGAKTNYKYDDFGNVVEIKDPLGRVTRYEYNALQQLTKMTDPEGNSTTFTYDAMGQITKIIDPLGYQTTYQYDQIGQLIKETNPKGHSISYTYNSLGLVTKIVNPLNATYSYAYDQMGNLIKMKDALGHESTFSYDVLGRLTKYVNEEGHETKYEYNLPDRSIKVIKPDGATSIYQFNEKFLLESMKDPNGNITSWTYDALGRMTSVKDAEGNINKYTYNELGQIVEIQDPKGQKVQYGYDSTGNVTSIIGPNGAKTEFHYNSAGELVKEVDPLKQKTEYTYTANGLLKSVKNPLGETTSYHYDALQRLTKVTDPLGNTMKISYDEVGNIREIVDREGFVTKMSYDAAGNMTTLIDAKGDKWHYQYDLNDRLLEVMNPHQQKISFTYNKIGNIKSFKDERGFVTKFNYNQVGRLVKVTDPLGYTVTYGYDKAGNMIKITNQQKHTSTFVYDKLNRLVQEINPKGDSTAYTYDELGNVTSVKDAEGRVTSYEYDSVGNLTKVTDALGNRTTYLYDKLGQMTKMIDAKGNKTEWVYDALGQVIKEINTLGEVHQYVYDQVGNLVQETDPKGQTIHYSYNKRQELTGMDLGDEILTYSYDAVGNMVKAVSPATTEIYEYDALNRLTAMTNTKLAKTTRFTYDAAGNRTQIKDPEDRIIQYEYNGRNELTKLIDPDENVTSFTYNGVGQITTISRSNGIQTTYDYDKNSQLTSVKHQGEKFLASFKYTYDKVGNRLTQVEEDGAKTVFKYDALNRLTEVTYPKEKIETIRNTFYTPPNEKKGRKKQSSSKNGEGEESEDSSLITDLINRIFGGGNQRDKEAEEKTQNKIINETNIENKIEADTKEKIEPLDTNNNVSKESSSDNGEKTFFDRVFEKVNEVIKNVVNFFKRIWKGIVNFFNPKVEAKEKEDTNNQKPNNAKLPSSEKQKEQEKTKNKDDNSDQKKRKGKEKKEKQGGRYHGVGKGPKDWNQFYQDGPASFNETPDYVKNPVRKVTYKYDKVGNRIEQSEDGKVTKYRYNALNELVQAGDEYYYYDVNGNLIQKETKEGTIKYEYTTDNRLKGVYYPDGSQVEYEYDALRRKVVRNQEYYDASLIGNGRGRGVENALNRGKGEKNGLKKKLGKALYQETTQYLYDGVNVFKEYGENGQPLAQYYIGADQVVARKMFGFHGRKQEGYEGNLRTRGGLLYYHEDALGNIMDVTDRIGEPIMKYRYDAFGNLFTQMQAPYNVVGFTGKSYDAKAGLIDFAARWYSPNEGRFITEDTFTGWMNIPQSLNRFTYAHNNPATFTDPTGRCIVMEDAPGCRFPPKDDEDNNSGGSGGTGGSGGSGSPGGDTGSGPVTPPPPPPTFEEILEMRSNHFRSLAGLRTLYDYGTNLSIINRYVFNQSKISGYGFDGSQSFFPKWGLPQWKKFRLPSSSFKRQAGSMALDFIPVVGNIKSGIEAMTGRDIVTGEKLSSTDRIVAGIGVFTGGAGKTALKGIKAGSGFVSNSVETIARGSKTTKGTGNDSIFSKGAMKHIFHGEVNKKRNAVGYHHESMMGGKIIEVTDPPNQYGVYRAIVEIQGKGKRVPSTFFPKDWNRVQVVDAIKGAYQNKRLIKDNLYEGTLPNGMRIQMRLDSEGKVKTAYPMY